MTSVPATRDEDSRPHGHANPDDFWVVCLCAEWCHVCRDWQPRFQPLVAEQGVGARTLWLDVEDEEIDALNLDIETFPTLLILRRDQPLFLGAVPPVDEHIARLVKKCAQQSAPSPTCTASEQTLAALVWNRFICRLE